MGLRLVALVVVSLAIVVIGLTATYLMLGFRERASATTTITITSMVFATYTTTQTYTVTVPIIQTSPAPQEDTSASLNKGETLTRIGPCTNGIPYYVGSTLYTCLDLEVAKKLSDVIQGYLGLRNGTQIVMFGLTSCPHCHVMHEFFTSNNEYRGIYIVIWLDRTIDGGRVFEDLYLIEILNSVHSHIAGAVPHIYIIRDGLVRTVVVGEITEKIFWDELTKL